MKINQGDYFVLNDGAVFKCLHVHDGTTYSIHAILLFSGPSNRWELNKIEKFTINGIYEIGVNNSKYDIKKL